jgi:hypothetical protein
MSESDQQQGNQDGNILGLSTSQLAGLSADELTENPANLSSEGESGNICVKHYTKGWDLGVVHAGRPLVVKNSHT